MIGRRQPPNERGESAPRGFDDFDLRIGDVMRGTKLGDAQVMSDAMAMRLHATVAQTVHKHVSDPRLRQLIEHFLQYVGSSPFLAPTILTMIMSAQQDQGCWYSMGGTRMVARTLEAFGALHCASNNAARGAGFHLLTELDRKRWDGCLAATLTGVWLCMKHQIPAMLEAGGGSIVNITSVSGMRGEASQSAYSAAKGGVIALTKTAAAEFAQRGVRVNAVAPGGVETPSIAGYFERVPEIKQATLATHAMRRLGRPEEIADAVVYLCSDRSSFVTGHVLVADGGVLVNPHSM